MKRAGKALLVTTVATALGTAGTVYAYAGGWTLTDNPGILRAAVAKMPRGVEPGVATQSSQAVVTWSAQEIVPGVRMDHYVVTAHSESDPPQADLERTVPANDGNAESVTFSAEQVGGGNWRWTIVPRYRQWAGAESEPSRRLAFPPTPVATTLRLRMSRLPRRFGRMVRRRWYPMG